MKIKKPKFDALLAHRYTVVGKDRKCVKCGDKTIGRVATVPVCARCYYRRVTKP